MTKVHITGKKEAIDTLQIIVDSGMSQIESMNTEQLHLLKGTIDLRNLLSSDIQEGEAVTLELNEVEIRILNAAREAKLYIDRLQKGRMEG